MVTLIPILIVYGLFWAATELSSCSSQSLKYILSAPFQEKFANTPFYGICWHRSRRHWWSRRRKTIKASTCSNLCNCFAPTCGIILLSPWTLETGPLIPLNLIKSGDKFQKTQSLFRELSLQVLDLWNHVQHQIPCQAWIDHRSKPLEIWPCTIMRCG